MSRIRSHQNSRSSHQLLKHFTGHWHQFSFKSCGAKSYRCGVKNHPDSSLLYSLH